MLPTFIIAGAQKAGTTALRIYLSQHDEVFMADKEIHFFDRDENFSKGLEWYESFFDHDDSERVVGEKTPDYMYDERVAERIYEFLPDVKLIFVLRNPIDRAYSHYWHNVRRGVERNSFHDAVKKEIAGVTDTSYLDRGKYVIQLRKFAKFFSKSDMLFLRTEDLKSNTVESLKMVLEFLNVNKDFEFSDLKKKHVGGVPRSVLIAKLCNIRPIKDIRFIKDGLLFLNTKKGEKPDMKRKTKKLLKHFFSDYNSHLSQFTDMDLSMWE